MKWLKRLTGGLLGRRYGHAGMPPADSYGMTSHDLGNNESYGTGISYHEDQGSPWLALTGTQSQWFRTFAGAKKWLAKRGYDAHGRRSA